MSNRRFQKVYVPYGATLDFGERAKINEFILSKIGVNVMLRTAVVVNTTKGTTLASSAKLATTYGERRQGLLGRSSLEEGEGLIIRPCKGVHSFGMKFPIDVAYVSKDGEILHIISPLHPNRLGPLMLRAAWILELPQGVLSKTETCPGDILAIRT
jgi:uncharacterized membrane protein (UPF0127 family)